VSKKKGMLSWLGLGKQEEQASNAAHVLDEQNDSQEAIEPIKTSSEVTLSDLAEATTTAEVIPPLKAPTQDAFHLQSEVDVTSTEGDNVPQVTREVSANKKQTDQISEKSANSESNEIVKKRE
jgi:hypothetical protein